MVKIYYIGDFISKNGPSIFDINLYENLQNQKEVDIKKEQINKKFNSNLIKKIIKSEVIVISGVSLKGIIFSSIGRILFKKIFFIMHGCLKIEKKFRKVPYYRKIMELIQIILCNGVIGVSIGHSETIKTLYRKKKVIGINSGIFIKKKEGIVEEQKEKGLILTTGGGRREKGVLNIVKAISKINDKNIKLIVVGEVGSDTLEIKKYKFVEYLGFINHKELEQLMKKAEIYIQNSNYEAFGIAPLEAANQDCKLIISKAVNSKDLLYEDTYYCIQDSSNENEIKKLILEAMQKITLPQFKKIRTWEEVAKEYLNCFVTKSFNSNFQK